jgi:NAD(P)-dependent dehydrogenase (short-subunit alcohol dehydrogenase family)
MSKQFSDKTALVTGAASGIGAATARLLHERGAQVVLADIDRAGGTRLCAELGAPASFVELDVASERGWDEVCSQLLDQGPLHLLVHSAGIAAKARLADTTLHDFTKMLNVNLVSTFLAIRAAARVMTVGGSVVALSSIRGVLATAELGSYGASKFGVRALTRVAALELADSGIRVNSVCPGSIDTPITGGRGFQNDDSARYIQSIPLKRRGSAEEVATAIAFLLSEDAAYVTGTDFMIDGGMSAGRTAPPRTPA